jgi:prophage regulatory protein
MPHADSTASADHRVNIVSDLLRLPAVVRHTGLSRSTIYRLMAARHFPAPVKLAGRAVGWRKADVDRWSASLSSAAH